MTSLAHDAFIRPAMRRPQLWRLGVGICLMAVVYLLWVIVVFSIGWRLVGTGTPMSWAGAVAKGETPSHVLIQLTTFGGMALAPMMVVRMIHARGAATLMGRGAVVLRDFGRSVAVLGGLMLISLGIWSLAYDAVPNLAFDRWLAILPFALVGVLVQTGAEELVFRGYLQQQLGARFPRWPVWLLAPSLLFGLVHLNTDIGGASAWLVVAAATLFGLIAADLTARTGSIGAAWGVHFGNNCFALLILATQGTLPGLSLYVTPYSVDQLAELLPILAADLGLLVMAWLLLRRLLPR